MAGSFPSLECTGVVASSVAVIPKKEPGKLCIIISMFRPTRLALITTSVGSTHM